MQNKHKSNKYFIIAIFLHLKTAVFFKVNVAKLVIWTVFWSLCDTLYKSIQKFIY